VEITFKDKKLRKAAASLKLLIQVYGKRRGELIKVRLDDLLTAETLEDVRYLPGHYHELTQDRKGQWACDLDHPYRLIFTPHDDPIPANEDGQYIWMEVRGVEIIEITDYH
jgi:toxin HigB-1